MVMEASAMYCIAEECICVEHVAETGIFEKEQ